MSFDEALNNRIAALKAMVRDGKRELDGLTAVRRLRSRGGGACKPISRLQYAKHIPEVLGDRPLCLREIKEALIERGVDPRRVGDFMAKAAKSGKVKRLARGVYALPEVNDEQEDSGSLAQRC